MNNPTDNKPELAERLRESAEAFRKYPIYTCDGDPVLLTTQADEFEQAADALTEALRVVREASGGLSAARVLLPESVCDRHGINIAFASLTAFLANHGEGSE